MLGLLNLKGRLKSCNIVFKQTKDVKSAVLNSRVCRRQYTNQFKEDMVYLSFYKYANILDPVKLQQKLLKTWSAKDIFGRIYVANEGINAQMSVPISKYESFVIELNRISQDYSMGQILYVISSFNCNYLI